MGYWWMFMSKSWEMWLCEQMLIWKGCQKDPIFDFLTENLQNCNKNKKTRLQHITHTYTLSVIHGHYKKHLYMFFICIPSVAINSKAINKKWHRFSLRNCMLKILNVPTHMAASICMEKICIQEYNDPGVSWHDKIMKNMY